MQHCQKGTTASFHGWSHCNQSDAQRIINGDLIRGQSAVKSPQQMSIIRSALRTCLVSISTTTTTTTTTTTSTSTAATPTTTPTMVASATMAKQQNNRTTSKLQKNQQQSTINQNINKKSFIYLHGTFIFLYVTPSRTLISHPFELQPHRKHGVWVVDEWSPFRSQMTSYFIW